MRTLYYKLIKAVTCKRSGFKNIVKIARCDSVAVNNSKNPSMSQCLSLEEMSIRRVLH